MAVININEKSFTLSELKELVTLMENQETTDKYIDCTLDIRGNDGDIKVYADEYGDITVL